MNRKQVVLAIVLVDFAALTAYAVYHYGYLGFFAELLANAVTVTAAVDLVIALVLVMIWMVRDAARRGIAVAPYVVITLLTGSIGPLAYLIRREAAPSLGTASD